MLNKLIVKFSIQSLIISARNEAFKVLKKVKKLLGSALKLLQGRSLLQKIEKRLENLLRFFF